MGIPRKISTGYFGEYSYVTHHFFFGLLENPHHSIFIVTLTLTESSTTVALITNDSHFSHWFLERDSTQTFGRPFEPDNCKRHELWSFLNELLTFCSRSSMNPIPLISTKLFASPFLMRTTNLYFLNAIIKALQCGRD